MELRQPRYFVRVVEIGSVSRATLDLDLAPSALSRQVSRLEGELPTRLLQRTRKGGTPTEAVMAFSARRNRPAACRTGLAPTTTAGWACT